MDISETWNGIIMAAYPTGLSLSSIVASVLIFKMGTRTATFVGLLGTSLACLVFGFVPDITGTWNEDGSTKQDLGVGNQIGFLVVYFMGGLCAVAENAVLVVCAIRFKERVATVISLVGSTAAGLGCMAGPPLGGFLYALGPTAAWKFRIPFIAFSVIGAALAFFTLFTIPQVREQKAGEEQAGDDGGGSTAPADAELQDPASAPASASASALDRLEAATAVEEEGKTGASVAGDAAGGSDSPSQEAPPAGKKKGKVTLRSLLTLQCVTTLVAMGLNGTVVATLDPTLAYRLKAPPFNYDSGMIGLFFSFSSVTYVVTSVPIGWLVDRYPGSVFVFKGVQGVGFVLLFLTFFLLGPFNLPFIPQGFETALNTVGAVAAAMVFKGIGSAGNSAAYPDLMVDVPADNVALQGFMSGLWNCAYGVGWAAGPLIGGALYDIFHDNEGGGSADSVGFDSFSTTQRSLTNGLSFVSAI
eukprot:g2560.t1